MPSCQRSPYSDCWAINSAVQAASPRYRLAHSSTAGQAQGKAGHSDVRQGQDAGQGCVLLAPSPPVLCVAITSCPAASCRLCGQGPSFQAPIRQISFGPAACASFFPTLLKNCLDRHTLLYICLRKTPNQQHQNQYQRSAVLPDRFSRSHAILGSCFFPPRFCAAYYTSYPASSALTRKEPSSAEETAQSQLLSKWLITARKTMIIPVATCVRK